jgi:hypothetical protein
MFKGVSWGFHYRFNQPVILNSENETPLAGHVLTS